MQGRARNPWDRLAEVERDIGTLEAERLRAISDIAAAWPEDPYAGDLICELATHCRISKHEAFERLRIAEAARELPDLTRAHARGTLSWGQLRWVSRFATAETDGAWADRAPGMSPNQLRLEWRRQMGARQREAAVQHDVRYLWSGWDDDGRSLSIEGRMAAEQGAAFEEAVTRAARDVEPDPDAEDPGAARRADALMHLVTSASGKPARPTLVVHADADVLAGLTDGSRKLSETSSGVQLPPESIRRMACDARLRIALERDGAPVGVATSGRHVSSQQWDLLVFRDRGCTYPGCEVTRHLHAHHIRHWADGGRTTLDNLVLLCARHHRMLHEGGWSIRGRPPDALEFVDRWGEAKAGVGSAMAGTG